MPQWFNFSPSVDEPTLTLEDEGLTATMEDEGLVLYLEDKDLTQTLMAEEQAELEDEEVLTLTEDY